MRTIQIEKVLKEADYVLKDNPQLLKMFKQCFVSTIETTLKKGMMMKLLLLQETFPPCG